MSARLYHAASVMEDDREEIHDALADVEQARVKDIEKQFEDYESGAPTADMNDVIAAICNESNAEYFIRAVKAYRSGKGTHANPLSGFLITQAIYYVANEAITKEAMQ